MRRKFYLYFLLSLFFLADCGQETAGFAPIIIIDQAIKADFNQIEFWLFDNIGTDNVALTCDDFMKTGADAISPSHFSIAYSGKFTFNLDQENAKEFSGVPAGKGYILYVRGYNVISNGQKIMKAHACQYNVSIEADNTTQVTIKLEAAD